MTNLQLKLSKVEMDRLARRVEQDYLWSVGDHQRRMERFRGYYQKFRNRVDPPELGDEEASNFSVPLVQWHTYARWARDVSGLLGDDAEIIAAPVNPTAQKLVKKIGRYMTWRMFDSMRITNPLAVFLFRKCLFGRSHAYAPYVRDTYTVRGDDGRDHDEVWFEGPGFTPLWPDDLIVPAEDAESIHDFSFCIRRYRATPEDLLDGEKRGLYQGITENFQNIVNFAQKLRHREFFGEEIKREKDEAEGVLYEGGLSARDSLIVHEWYGKWRRLKGKKDAREDNLAGREQRESELVVRFLPEMNLVVGAQDLADLYPKKRQRRPFVEASLVKDGSYWSPGLGELLYTIEDEASANHNLFTEAGQLSVGPVIFFKPGSGFDEEKFKYEPGTAYPSEDPAGVKVVTMQGDLAYAIQKEQAILGYAERVDAVTDFSLGRTQSQPNAPRTASGQAMMLQEGNVRVALDTTVMREDMGIIAAHFWELDSELSPPSVFFRATEEDADGLWDVKDGFGSMTSEERGGRYDFDIKFATSIYSKEATKQNQLALYQIDMQNPLIVQNPNALWATTNKLHAAFGDDNFADVVPAPPTLDAPKPPKEEWALALQDQDFHVNPMDNDQLHLMDHYKRLTAAQTDPDRDEQAVHRMTAHVIEHQQQVRQKMLMQAMAQRLAQSLGQTQPGQPGLHMGPSSMSLQDLHGTLGNLIGQPGGPGAAAPGQQPQQSAQPVPPGVQT